MTLGFSFFFNSILLGVGLAMDAFSVSLANGLRAPEMRPRQMCGIALVFALFQAAMPMIGWLCVRTVVQAFQAFERLIPWIALILLGIIGGNLLKEGLSGEENREETASLTLGALLMQGVATSIDALSVGFTIADYDVFAALLAAFLIAAVTFVICLCGVCLGRKMGTRLAGKAGILGGVILIFIGVEIFVSSFL